MFSFSIFSVTSLITGLSDKANALYEYFVDLIKSKIGGCETGKFGAYMKTVMETDGPVTIVMDSEVLSAPKK